LLRALLLQAFYTVRSERQLMEQLDYNLLFRWFVGLSIDEPVWDATVFCKNRDRLLDGDVATKFFGAILNLPQVRKLLSCDHFTVDGTLIEAWASMKSFVSKDGGDPPSNKGQSGGRNAERNFHGEKRTNDTHSSITDPDARLFRKGAGKEAKLCHMGHLMTENRNGLIVDAQVTEATGTAERETGLEMIDDNASPGSTVGADKLDRDRVADARPQLGDRRGAREGSVEDRDELHVHSTAQRSRGRRCSQKRCAVRLQRLFSQIAAHQARAKQFLARSQFIERLDRSLAVFLRPAEESIQLLLDAEEA
jgi:hypothetical protein